MTWREAVEELLASVPPEVRARVERQLEPLEEAQMQRDAALYALDQVMRVIHESKDVLAQAGIVLPVDVEMEEQRKRDLAQYAAAFPSEADDQAFVDAAGREVLAKTEWEK